jgi:transposase, IS5 family
MYRREHRHQLSFEDFFLPFGGKLSGDSSGLRSAETRQREEEEEKH